MKLHLVFLKKWKSAEQRIKDLEVYLSRKDRLGGIYGNIQISWSVIDHEPLTLLKNGMFSESQVKKVTEQFRSQADAVGLIHPMIEAPFWGAYFPNTEKGDYKMDFYILTDENTKLHRPSGRFHNFERSVEHEMAHAVALDLGLKNQGQDTKYVEGADNTHYYFLGTEPLDDFYKEIQEAWKKKFSVLSQMLTSASQLLATLLAKKKIDEPVNDLLPEVKEKMEKLIQICDLLDMPIRVTSGFRTIEEQNKLYAQGRTTAGNIVTNAKGLESKHCQGKAFDIVFRKTGYEGNWELIGQLGEQLGLNWGGRWKSFQDKPHFEI
jgi:hypothetical protein